MATPTVRDVMTDTVVAVRERAHYKEIVAALIDNGISSVPVLDSDDRVVGVVTEADLLPKVEFSGDDPRVKLFERRRPARVKAAGDDAAALMSSPVVTINTGAPIAIAARLMETERVKRLPVIRDDGRLAGIVSRRDLLKVYLRPDAQIAEEVTGEVLDRTVGIADQVKADVIDGVVTLRGEVDRRSTARITVRLARGTTGVVDVLDEMTWRDDDTASARRRHGFDGQV
jgi:CBS domain-containing protein